MNDQTELDLPEPQFMIIRPYRVTRGRVNAQILIDVDNMLKSDMQPAAKLSAVRQILGNVNWGLKKG